MLGGAPTFAEVHPYLAGLLSGRVVVGHNVDRFDLAFLRAECERLGEDRVPVAVVSLDTLLVAQTYLDLPGKARLVDCCDRYRLTWADHHSALGDARVTADLLGAMRAELGDDLLAHGSRSWPTGGSGVARGRHGPTRWPGTAPTPCRPEPACGAATGSRRHASVRAAPRPAARSGPAPGRRPASRPCRHRARIRPPGASG